MITKLRPARREAPLARVIYALGITGIGLANARVICRYYRNDLDAMRSAQVEELSEIEGIGEVLAKAFHDYFREEKNAVQLDHLLQEITIAAENMEESEQTLAGLSFVITGSDLGESFSIDSALIVGELYRNGAEWEFKSVGKGFQGGLAALCDHYGVAYK